MAQELAEVRTIAENPAAPTFENTFVAMEKSGQLIWRVMRVFNAVTGANLDPELQKVRSMRRRSWPRSRTRFISTRSCSSEWQPYTTNAFRSSSIRNRCGWSSSITRNSCIPGQTFRRRQGQTEKAERRGIDSFQCVQRQTARRNQGRRVPDHRSGRTFGAERRANRVCRAGSQGPQRKWLHDSSTEHNPTAGPGCVEQSLDPPGALRRFLESRRTRRANDTRDTIGAWPSFEPRRPNCLVSQISRRGNWKIRWLKRRRPC